MNANQCEQLDEFLLGDLTGTQRADFERHFDLCQACRLAVQHQTTIDGLLREATQAIAVPSGLKPRVHTILKRHQRRSRTAAATAVIVLASAAMLLAGMFLVSDKPPAEPGPKNEFVQDGPQAVQPDRQPDTPAAAPRVRVELPQDVIAIPVDSGDPNVTLIRVFHTTTTQANTP